VLQVERLDLERRPIVGCTETPGDVRKIFLQSGADRAQRGDGIALQPRHLD